MAPVTDPPALDPSDGKYVVVVEVFDPGADPDAEPDSIGYDFIVVVITADERNDAPVLDGRSELTIMEIDGGAAECRKTGLCGEHSR